MLDAGKFMCANAKTGAEYTMRMKGENVMLRTPELRIHAYAKGKSILRFPASG
jgi:uncharacterized protein YacL (UPF0231 family)